jgi:hypothetical protein
VYITETNTIHLVLFGCRMGHLVPIWQPLIGSSFHSRHWHAAGRRHMEAHQCKERAFTLLFTASEGPRPFAYLSCETVRGVQWYCRCIFQGCPKQFLCMPGIAWVLSEHYYGCTDSFSEFKRLTHQRLARQCMWPQRIIPTPPRDLKPESGN